MIDVRHFDEKKLEEVVSEYGYAPCKGNYGAPCTCPFGHTA